MPQMTAMTAVGPACDAVGSPVGAEQRTCNQVAGSWEHQVRAADECANTPVRHPPCGYPAKRTG